MTSFKPRMPLLLSLLCVVIALPASSGDHTYNATQDITNATTWTTNDTVAVANTGGGDITVTVKDVNYTGAPTTLEVYAAAAGDSTLVFSATSPSITFSDTVTIAGSGSGGVATLKVDSGGRVLTSKSTELGGNAVLDVTGTYTTNGLLLAGTNAEAVVRAGGVFTVSGDTTISNGTLTIESGVGYVGLAGVSVEGPNAVMNVGGTVTITGGKTIALTNQGTLNITDDATIVGDVTNTSGIFNVEVGTTLAVNGSVTSTAGTGGSSPTYGTKIDGTMNATRFIVDGGAALVAGQADADTIMIAGGQLDIEGQLTGDTAEFTGVGGTVNVQAGGFMNVDDINIGGSTIVNVKGTVTSADVDVAGSTVNVTDGGKLGTTASAINKFTVSGSNAVVNVQGADSELNAATLSFSGGTINITGGATMNAGAVDSFVGKMNINSGNANFNNSFQIDNGGSVVAGANGAAIGLGAGATMTVASGGAFDLTGGDATVTGNLSISAGGIYTAGYNKTTGTVNMASVNGNATISSGAAIRLSFDLQGKVNSMLDDLATTPLTILEATDVSAGGTLSWTSGSYQYIYGLDSSGNLAVVDAIAISEDERYENLIALWNKDPSMHGHATQIIDRNLGKAITDGHAIRVGDPDKFASYSLNGQYNLDALASIAEGIGMSEPEYEGGPLYSGYSGLMLYSGSGLNLVNRAVLESTGSITRRVVRRNDAVRHELALAAASLDPDLAACMDNPENRLWVDGSYLSEHQSRDAGFAGYKYRPIGLTLGYDKVLGNQVVVGAAFAYAGGDFEDLAAVGSDSTISTYAALLYGSYNHCSGLYISGALGYAYSDNDIRDRRVISGELGWNRAEYHNKTLMAAVRLGVDIEPVEYLTITPSVGFNYQNSHSSSHNQFFRGDLGSNFNTLTVGKMRNHSATIPFELRVGYDLVADDDSLLNVSLLGGYAYETHDKGVSGSYGFGGLGDFGTFAPVGKGVGRHVMNLGAGLKYLYKQYEFGVDYDYYGRTNYGAHSIIGRFGISF